jgi:hypothetical protein
MVPGPHLDLLMEAIAKESQGHSALLAGDTVAAEQQMREASRLYRDSWELAPPGSYGRLVGMLKAAVIAGAAETEAEYVRGQIGDPGESAPAHYALALAALVLEDDGAALAAAEGMEGASPAFDRTASAIVALSQRDGDRYAEAVASIVEDFEGREEHLTGVAIADTALALDRLAQVRGMACAPASPLMPPAGGA